MNNLSIIIAAAGKGTRMCSTTSKVLFKIGNLELINHIINTAKKLNPSNLCLVCSPDNFEQVRSKILDDTIIFAIQNERLGTAHAVRVGLDKLPNNDLDNILVMYGDVPFVSIDTYQKIIDLLNNSNASIVNVGFYTSNIQNKYGRFIVNNDNLLKIIEYKDASDDIKNISLCNSGILIVKKGLLSNLLKQVNNNNASKEYYLTDIVNIAQQNNMICKYIIALEEEVCGINSQMELAVAEKLFQERKRQEFMSKGVTLIDPNTVYFSYDTEIENDVVIQPNVIFLSNVKIKKNVLIRSFSYLEDCVIESGVSVGPFARIRGGVCLNENCRIGNFVEIKNSKIGVGTKINHLTYIGDTTIGNNTNIGAGCITCNYDGFVKHHTEIGNNCFIGSNTVIISPLQLSDNCITGAGSVITKNVDPNDIAISRCEQKNLKNGAISYRKKRQNQKL